MVSYAKYPAPGNDPAALKGYLPIFPNAFNIGTPAAFCTATALGIVKPTPVVIGFSFAKVCSSSFTGLIPILGSNPAVSGYPPGPVKSSSKDAIRGINLRFFFIDSGVASFNF
jgi:hypothetical protein